MSTHSQLSSRLSKIEEALQPASKGFRHLYTFDQQTYYEPLLEPGEYPWRKAMNGCSGEPEPGDPAYTKEEIEAMEDEGWQLNIIQWVNTMPDSMTS